MKNSKTNFHFHLTHPLFSLPSSSGAQNYAQNLRSFNLKDSRFSSKVINFSRYAGISIVLWGGNPGSVRTVTSGDNRWAKSSLPTSFVITIPLYLSLGTCLLLLFALLFILYFIRKYQIRQLLENA